MRFEEKVSKMEEDRLMKMYWIEKREMIGSEEYSKEKEKFLNEKEWNTIGYELERARKKDIISKIQRRGKDIQEQEIEIRDSKYNKRYKYERKKGMPEYLRESRSEKEIKDKAKLRCGNMENANRYWLSEEEKKCILCGKEEGRLEHLIGQCEVSKKSFDQMEGFVHEKIYIYL